ncbi:MAG: RnfABCDGE type electron transport complex subunit D [Oscillospiraceae bacterium]|nr:RnfABCDGE type electron transport complex subunit D [Oscillospiraceae bacterium]
MQEMPFSVSASPHLRAEDSTRSIMLDVIIALMPALIYAVVYAWSWRAAIVVGISVMSCVLFEWMYRKLTRQENSTGDLSAIVSGMLLAYMLPVGVPYWIPVVGAFFAIIVVKQLYGGLGKNFMNPALAAYVFLLLSFPRFLTLFHESDIVVPLWRGDMNAGLAETPLALLQRYGQEGVVLPTEYVTTSRLLFGQHAGAIGEVSVILLLVGLLYLLIRRVVSLRIPLAFIGTVALVTFIFPQADADRVQFMLSHLLTGSLILGAIFMATDYSTSPVTGGGQWVYGIGCGLLTVLIRYSGAMPEGVPFAILIMNACVWIFDKYMMPRRFGVKWLARLKRTWSV